MYGLVPASIVSACLLQQPVHAGPLAVPPLGEALDTNQLIEGAARRCAFICSTAPEWVRSARPDPCYLSTFSKHGHALRARLELACAAQRLYLSSPEPVRGRT